MWDPRKALGDLVALFARQFSARDKVTLLIKTSAEPSSFAAGTEPDAPIASLVRAEVDKAYAETGVSAAPIALVAAEDISGRTIDVLHAVGDCFVSSDPRRRLGPGRLRCGDVGQAGASSPDGEAISTISAPTIPV